MATAERYEEGGHHEPVSQQDKVFFGSKIRTTSSISSDQLKVVNPRESATDRIAMLGTTLWGSLALGAAIGSFIAGLIGSIVGAVVGVGLGGLLWWRTSD